MQRFLTEKLNNPKILLGIGFCVVALYLALAIGTALRVRPEVDEGLFASPAINLVNKGFMGTTVLDTEDTTLTRIDQRTYWIMPLYPLNLAVWFNLLGEGIVTMRLLSAFWGLMLISAWFVTIRKLSGDAKMALFASTLIALDYSVVNAAALGRMDLMSSALGACAFAAYFSLRERNLVQAILASQIFVVASGMTHPNGILAFCGIAFITIYFDAKRLNLKHFALAGIPYLIGAVGWGAYILQDTAAFRDQFVEQFLMGGRTGGFSSPLQGIIREITERYPDAYGLGAHSAGHGGKPIYLKSLILIAYVAGVVGSLFTPAIRRNKNYKALLIVAGIYFVLMGLIDGQKQTPYVVHIIPFFLALFAVWFTWAWRADFVPKPLLALAISGLFVLQIGGLAARMKNDTRGTIYDPAINFLKANTDEKTRIAGSAALGFGLGFPENFRNASKLGYISGKPPDVIVFGSEEQHALDYAKTHSPEFYEYVRCLLSEKYEVVYENEGFRIYQSKKSY